MAQGKSHRNPMAFASVLYPGRRLASQPTGAGGEFAVALRSRPLPSRGDRSVLLSPPLLVERRFLPTRTLCRGRGGGMIRPIQAPKSTSAYISLLLVGFRLLFLRPPALCGLACVDYPLLASGLNDPPRSGALRWGEKAGEGAPPGAPAHRRPPDAQDDHLENSSTSTCCSLHCRCMWMANKTTWQETGRILGVG